MRIDSDLIRRYDRPGPRYTSYPTAAEFHDGVTPDVYGEHLAQAGRNRAPLALYVHLPFCRARCFYCACNVVITRQPEVVHRYLRALAAEIRRTAEQLGARPPIAELHWGGGTPTHLSADELRALHRVLRESFSIDNDTAQAIEVDPRVTTEAHLAALADLGFARLSMGVQDFDADVQEHIGRRQPYEMTRACVDAARDLGFASINLDLIYGLPGQTRARFRRTLDRVAALRPERVAIYSYAHMPWLKANQRYIDAAALPAAEEKLGLLLDAIDALGEAGYLAVGMDHFALPEDELGAAIREGTLGRNFMGYTVHKAPHTVALGMSAISDVTGAFVQNERKLSRYEAAVAAGRLPVERGYLLSEDDHLRRHVIHALMCTFRLDVPDVEQRFGVDFASYFRDAVEALGPMRADGLVELDDEELRVLNAGRTLVRNVCMAFDAHLQPPSASRPRYSRTV